MKLSLPLQNIRDSISPIDRLLKNVAIVGEEAAKEGKAGFSGYLLPWDELGYAAGTI